MILIWNKKSDCWISKYLFAELMVIGIMLCELEQQYNYAILKNTYRAKMKKRKNT